MSVKKKIDNSPTRYVLPSRNDELQSFSKKFKIDMMEQVVGIIEFAIHHDLPTVEVFQFKNSDFVITLSEKDYLTNLNNIYNHYMKNESYEHCVRLVRLLKIIKENSVKIHNENQTSGKN